MRYGATASAGRACGGTVFQIVFTVCFIALRLVKVAR
jgi:hypothetical protein